MEKNAGEQIALLLAPRTSPQHGRLEVRWLPAAQSVNFGTSSPPSLEIRQLMGGDETILDVVVRCRRWAAPPPDRRPSSETRVAGLQPRDSFCQTVQPRS